jgi:monooxygenase
MTAAEQQAAGPEAGTEHADVLIVGAGLSGIGAAHHLKDRFPGKSYLILEAREAIGGTWDLFRYPGVRSDSDMFTLGYRFRPWPEQKAIADGPSILRYIRETAAEACIDRRIRFGHRVVSASWSSAQARWTVQATRGDGQTVRFSCRFLLACSGYYRYDQGYSPSFAGSERFTGQIVHPQHWPDDLDYDGKRVVVIGSGATAVTLVPALTDRAAHVTMLQRSPSYILSVPGSDPIANRLRKLLGDRASYPVTRWKNVALTTLLYQVSRRRPELVKKLIRSGVSRQLPAGYDVGTHFSPRYQPWDQRLCLVPDGDLFKAIRAGKASVVTGQIEEFTSGGIRLASGAHLEADIVVTATGLNLMLLGGMTVSVDGRRVDPAETFAYKGMMLSGVPNFAFTVGYTNASWTLKADLVSEYLCRVLRHMDARGHRQCVPVLADPAMPQRPLLDLTSGYVQRSLGQLPRSGSRRPWRLGMSYAHDVLALRYGRIDDGVLRFSGPGPQGPKVPSSGRCEQDLIAH